MSTRRRWLLVIISILGVLLLLCVGFATFAVISAIMSGGLTVPYPDGPPPTPTP